VTHTRGGTEQPPTAAVPRGGDGAGIDVHRRVVRQHLSLGVETGSRGCAGVPWWV